MKIRLFPLLLTAILLCADKSESQEISNTQTSQTKFTLTENEEGLTINFDGHLFARYDLHTANKPYLWPIIGPKGIPMTRAFPMKDSDLDEEDQRDHPHHRGLWFGHASISGFHLEDDKDRKRTGGDTWHERLTYAQAEDRTAKLAKLASIKHREFKVLDANDERAVIVQICDYLDRDGKRFLQEQRKLAFYVSTKTRTIDVDQKFIASDGDVVFHDRKDAGLAIRVPAAMAVDSKQGGRVLNSTGETDGDAWSKRARWCDYSGRVQQVHLGVAILNHPDSYRFPTRWHVRPYGLFAANPFGAKALGGKFDQAETRLEQGDHLLLKHRFIFHLGNETDAEIEKAWQQYSKEKNRDE